MRWETENEEVSCLLDVDGNVILFIGFVFRMFRDVKESECCKLGFFRECEVCGCVV
jgi:hypothetical protein